MEIGEHVTFVDEIGQQYDALVTNKFGDNNPSINVVYVSKNADESDPYGRQIARRTSVVHESNQYAHGMFWR